MVKVAAVQMVSSQEVDKSLQQADALIAEAATTGADCIFLPENFASLGNPAAYDIGIQEMTPSGPVRSFLREQASRHQVWLFGGTIPIASTPDGEALQGRVRAASLVVDGSGREVARYDKMHMFDVDVDDQHRAYRESDTFAHGETLELVDAPCGRVGLSVCYDLRFSELYLALFKAGAEVFSVPSAFTVPTGEAHFEMLIRARAIESFAYCVSACQGGDHDSGRKTYGNSMIVSPWGEILARAGMGEAIISAEIDLEQVAKARKDMPVLQQRRL